MGRRRIPPFETEITALGPKGVGVGIAPDGKPVHVRRAPPGGRVRVRPAGKRKGRWKGVRQALIRPPADGVTPPCPVFGLCGGCVLQELPLERQRALKLERARQAIGPVPDGVWRGIDGSPDAYGFRNKMEFSFGTRRYASEAEMRAAPDRKAVDLSGRFLGLHAPGRFDRIVDVAHCPLLDGPGNAVLDATRAHFGIGDGDGPALWDVRAHTGVLRHLLVRRGERSVYAGLFTASPPDAAVEQAISGWLDAMASLELSDADGPLAVQAGWYVNDEVADVARGALRDHRGAPDLVMALHGKRFSLAPLAFFQTSTAGAEVLIDTIDRALAPDGQRYTRLLDLYCGTGSIGICLSDRADEVIGIEEVAPAIENARNNAARNGVDATYRVAKVEDALDALSGGDGVAAVVDPPRAGLHPKVAERLATTPLDVLVYVACNPASLGRDRAALEAGGWRLTAAWAVDLFPQTGHLEVVARFEK
jgi:23S rRNA (uracil1939-C5)-methyltransferase